LAKSKTVYTCTECGGTSPKWAGQCPHCQQWNTLVETVAQPTSGAGARFQSLASSATVRKLSDIDAVDVPRFSSGIDEFDRVLGGGLVSGGVVLIGGDPGIGKSTLLLQALSNLATSRRVLYVSGEESGAQIALRARRLGIESPNLALLAEIQLERIQATIEIEKPEVVVIDSIQTLYSEALTSAPGSVAQVRECAAQLTRIAKRLDVTTILVGHVTKEGALAGPRVLEHIVDTVLYFEGDTHSAYRLVRAGDAGGHATAAGGDPGAGGHSQCAEPASFGRGPGAEPIGNVAGGPAPARRHRVLRSGRVPQCRGRGEDH
jgi:DNA repair protein RadA/Sms